MSALLDVQNVVGGYTTSDEIVKGVSLTVAPQELVVIIGPNGAGKSTLLKMIAGLLPVRRGAVRVADQEVANKSAVEIAHRGVAFVPQERNVFGGLTVRENLETSAYVMSAKARARSLAMLEQFPVLAANKWRSARYLSGGQRQILAMAMGLMLEPQLLLLDEPTAGLSPKAAEELFQTIISIKQTGTAVLMVEQNALDALAVSDRAYLLVAGKNSRQGAGSELSADPEIRRLFLGGMLHEKG
jgi:branched-chain amino acid transport system ATP-binding protein/neutral amino acid transport system ATP-binding protein